VVLRKVGCQKQCWGRCVKKHATAVAPPVKAAIIFRMILMVGTGALCVGTSTTIRSPFSFTSSNSMCAHVHYIIRTCFNSVDIQRLKFLIIINKYIYITCIYIYINNLLIIIIINIIDNRKVV